MTDEQKQKLADEPVGHKYARDFALKYGPTFQGPVESCHFGFISGYDKGHDDGLNRGLDECQKLRAALEPLLEWAVSNHEMPLYSEVIYNAELALQHTSQKDD